jgi:hypothetical protein
MENLILGANQVKHTGRDEIRARAKPRACTEVDEGLSTCPMGRSPMVLALNH